jgi:uncharacterized protein YhbP (UPF0306 family)
VSLQLIAKGYSSARVFEAISRILSANSLCSMATRSEAGVLDINAAFFSFSGDLELYFLSNPASAHCRNLACGGHLAVAVFDSRQEWGEAHAGLQLFGAADPVPSGQTERARASYAARFPRYFDLVIRAGEDPEATTGLGALRFYRFRPSRVKILDELEFGEDVYVTAEVVTS